MKRKPLGRKTCRKSRNRGAAAVLAMMFLVIFASLAAAMAIVAQGNLATADTDYHIHRALASTETGLQFLNYQLNQVTTSITTTTGQITAANAGTFWNSIGTALQAALAGDLHNISEPTFTNGILTIGPIAMPNGQPPFTITMTPHPIAGENYSSSYYTRPPYSQMNPAVSASNPLNATWIRVHISSTDGPANDQITRSIQMDYQLNRTIPYAILSGSRIMLGPNVMVQGNIASTFTETNLPNGHPIQSVSNFFGLNPTLDAQLTSFYNTVATNDVNGDNRLNLSIPAEVAGITNPAQYDKNGDGYIDEYDFFLGYFDTNNDGRVSSTELNTSSNVQAAELMQLIDTFGDPDRTGYNDGFIDNNDPYAKIQGTVSLSASMANWNAGAAGGNYHTYLQGAIVPDAGNPPIIFQDPNLNNYNFTSASNYDMSSYSALATGNFATQAAQQAALYNASNPSSPQPLGSQVYEEVPYGAAHPYDYYGAPVYTNMTFTNVTIPEGTNALFENCTFVGCTYVQTTTDNSDSNYNYAGMQLADGTYKYPSITATVNGNSVSNTKTLANNIRFDNCTIDGAVVSDVPSTFTVTRNKLQFTGTTVFNPNSSNLTASQQSLYNASSLLVPNYSVDVGSFTAPNSSSQTVTLNGTIVAGILDMRGQVTLNGSLVSTFQPVSNTGPVMGNTSPYYNTTIGYFSSSQGDLESEMPTAAGLGIIKINYINGQPLPNGIGGPVSLTPNTGTYFEGN